MGGGEVLARGGDFPRTGADVVRYVVSQVAPDELAGLPQVIEAYLDDPGPVTSARRRRGHVLGSGLETLTPLISPIVVAVVAQLLAELASDRIRKEAKAVSAWRRRHRKVGRHERGGALTSPLPATAAADPAALQTRAVILVQQAAEPPADASRLAALVVTAILTVGQPDSAEHEGPA